MLCRSSPPYAVVEQAGAGGQTNTMQAQLLEYLALLTMLDPN